MRDPLGEGSIPIGRPSRGREAEESFFLLCGTGEDVGWKFYPHLRPVDIEGCQESRGVSLIFTEELREELGAELPLDPFDFGGARGRESISNGSRRRTSEGGPEGGGHLKGKGFSSRSDDGSREISPTGPANKGLSESPVPVGLREPKTPSLPFRQRSIDRSAAESCGAKP